MPVKNQHKVISVCCIMETYPTQEINVEIEGLEYFTPERLLEALDRETQFSVPEFKDPRTFPILSDNDLQNMANFHFHQAFTTPSGTIINVTADAKAGWDRKSRLMEIAVYNENKPLKYTIVTPTPVLFSENLVKCLGNLFSSDLTDSYKLELVVSAGEDFNYSSAVNLGMSESVGDIILLNDDCYVSKGTIRSMREKSEDSGKVVGCQLRFPDGSLQHNGGKVVSNPVKVFIGLAIGKRAPFFAAKFFWNNCVKNLSNLTIFNSKSSASDQLDFVTAALCVVPRKVYEAIGGFDEKFYNQFDDVDFCFRARKQGFGLMMNYDSPAIHEEHKSLGKLYIDGNRNYELFANKWFPRKSTKMKIINSRFINKILEAVQHVFSI